MKNDFKANKVRKILLLLVPFVYAAVQLQSVTNRLFISDDPGEMVFVRALPLWRLLFGFDAFGLFRPVKNLLFLAFSRLEPLGLEWCHAIAIAIGIASFYAVFVLLRRVFGSEWKALAAAAAWILSPTLVSSAAWLSCLNIQVMAAFAALAIVFHDKAWDGGAFRSSRFFLACVFLFLALVSYECAIALAPILLAFDLTLRPVRLHDRRTWISHGCYWTVEILFLLLRHFAGAKGTAGGRWIEATRGQLVLSSPYFALQHVASWFWPFGRFSIGGSYVWGEVSGWNLAVCAMLGVGVLVAAFLLWKRRPALSFSLLFAILGLIPVCNFLGLGNGPYGDYYLTLASIGIAAGSVEIAWWFVAAKGKWMVPARSVVAAFVLARAAAVPEAARWAHLWTRYDLAYAESAKNYPNSVQNLNGSLIALGAEGKWEEVLETGRRIEDMVGADSRMMQGVYIVRMEHAILREKDKPKALSLLDRFIAVSDPAETGGVARFYRGVVAEVLDEDPETAEREYEAALEWNWDKNLVSCANSLAKLKDRRGEHSEAIALWERARGIDADNPTVLWNLAQAYRRAEEPEKWEPILRRLRELTGNPELTLPELGSPEAEKTE